jgi:hypothetical protein
MCIQAVRPCNDIFDSPCWWRNSFHNCCELFELQKTCYGYCYSFNSDVSEYSKWYNNISLIYQIHTEHKYTEMIIKKQLITLYIYVYDIYLHRKMTQYFVDFIQ